MAVLRYKGDETAPLQALVGKGLVFDSGGLSIKGDGGKGMKADMGGAALVLGTVFAAAASDAKVNLAVGSGRQVGSSMKPVALAAALPEEAARVFTADVPAVKQLAGAAFVAELAERTGGTPATARWDAGVVLSQITTLVGDDLVAEALRDVDGIISEVA